jgi:hypothetical protein
MAIGLLHSNGSDKSGLCEELKELKELKEELTEPSFTSTKVWIVMACGKVEVEVQRCVCF